MIFLLEFILKFCLKLCVLIPILTMYPEDFNFELIRNHDKRISRFRKWGQPPSAPSCSDDRKTILKMAEDDVGSEQHGRVGRVRVRALCRRGIMLKSGGMCLLAVLLLQFAAPGSFAAQETKSTPDLVEDAKGGEGKEEEGMANAKFTVVTHTVPRPPHRTDFVRMRDKVRRQIRRFRRKRR